MQRFTRWIVKDPVRTMTIALAIAASTGCRDSATSITSPQSAGGAPLAPSTAPGGDYEVQVNRVRTLAGADRNALPTLRAESWRIGHTPGTLRSGTLAL